MVTRDDVIKLAELSRLALSDAEIDKLQGEIASILAYVDTLKKVEVPETPDGSPYLAIENVMREDGEPHAGGMHTEELLKQFPRKDGEYLKVKKILG